MNDIALTLIHFLVTFVFSLIFLLVAACLLVFFDRKVTAWVSERYGPLHYGPGGIYQAFIDPIKLLLKEDVKAGNTDNVVFRLAPILFFAPVLTAFAVLPFSPYLTGSALGVGIVFYVAMSSLDVVALFMAGWGSNNKYALLGGLRATAQMISYELPLVLALAGVVMLTSMLAPGCTGPHPDLATCGVGSISFTQIAAAQMNPPWLWFILPQPLGLGIYIICGLAETNRTPFDLPESESELVAGYLTEYSGLRWAMFILGEYGNLTIVAAVATALFLGGWSGPGAAVGFWTSLLGSFWGQVVFNVICVFWFLLKMFGVIFLAAMLRFTLPRLRADQLMRFAWLFLMPLALGNIVLTGGLLLLPVSVPLRLTIAGVVNWALALHVIRNFRRLAGLSTAGRMPAWVARRPAALTSAPARPTVTPGVAEPVSTAARTRRDRP